MNAALIAIACVLGIAFIIAVARFNTYLIVLGIAKAVHWYMTLPEKTTDIAKASTAWLVPQAFRLHSSSSMPSTRATRLTVAANVTLRIQRHAARVRCAVKLYEAENLTGRHTASGHRGEFRTGNIAMSSLIVQKRQQTRLGPWTCSQKRSLTRFSV